MGVRWFRYKDTYCSASRTTGVCNALLGAYIMLIPYGFCHATRVALHPCALTDSLAYSSTC